MFLIKSSFPVKFEATTLSASNSIEYWLKTELFVYIFSPLQHAQLRSSSSDSNGEFSCFIMLRMLFVAQQRLTDTNTIKHYQPMSSRIKPAVKLAAEGKLSRKVRIEYFEVRCVESLLCAGMIHTSLQALTCVGKKLKIKETKERKKY